MDPLSKSKAKYIKSLQLKKKRLEEGRFIVEGSKSVLEFCRSGFRVVLIAGTSRFYAINDLNLPAEDLFLASPDELSGLGVFKKNDTAIAVVEIPQITNSKLSEDEIILALDNINDPGNLGTIIRTADWFGIRTILIGNGSVDIYNPKVVSSTKGSLTRVDVVQCDLEQVLASYSGNVYAADMTGKLLNEMEPMDSGIILMGNESHGISQDLNHVITERITILRHGNAESLNVGVATGIICQHLVKPTS